MKFGKSLSNQIEETLPEWRDKFLAYKDLKKKLKLIDPSLPQRQRPAKEETDFLQLLENQLEKFNSFFVEKEEEYIIRLKELQDRVAKSKDEVIKVRREIVDFHGEMVLLENYSALNYTGLVKILKKYDKRTGALIRLPFIQKVLHQPFFTTDILNKLVKKCEAMLDHLFPKIANETILKQNKHMDSLYMKSSVSALRVLKEIRSKSSTVSVFSLPPLHMGGGVEETWKKIPILDQVAN